MWQRMKNLTYSRENLDPVGLSHNLTKKQMSEQQWSCSLGRDVSCEKCKGAGMYHQNDRLHFCSCGRHVSRAQEAKLMGRVCPYCFDGGIIKLKNASQFFCFCELGDRQRSKVEQAAQKAAIEQERITEYQNLPPSPWTLNQVILVFILWGGVVAAGVKSIKYGGSAVLMTASISVIFAAVVHLLLVRDEKGYSWVSCSPERLFFYRSFQACLPRIMLGIVGGVLFYQGASRLSWFWPLCMVLAGVLLLVVCVLFFPRKS